MARPRFVLIVLAGSLLSASAPGLLQMQAQTPQSSPSSYDDMANAARRAEAEKEAAAQKHGKKSKAAPSATADPVAAAPAQTSASGTAPAAASNSVSEALSAVASTGSETPAATTPAPAETLAAAPATVPAAESTPAAAAAAASTPTAADAAHTAATGDAAAPAADGTVPSAVAAAGDAKEGGDGVEGEMPKVAPKMQRTLFGKMKPVKEKAPKLVPINIVHGELTVDGLIAKAGLNFQITDMKYFYIWVPGLGTTIVSNQPFPGSQIQESALNGSLLTVSVEGHQLQLACERDMLGGKKPKPISVFVALDKNFDKASIYPEFGYGTVLKAPYNWPGTLADLHPNTKAPPLPSNLRQSTQNVKTCQKNEDGTQGPCRTVEVPMVLGKS